LVSPSNPTAQLSVLREDATAPVGAQVTVEVADVDAVHAEAVRRGLELVHPLISTRRRSSLPGELGCTLVAPDGPHRQALGGMSVPFGVVHELLVAL
jgi:hypothetical protein